LLRVEPTSCVIEVTSPWEAATPFSWSHWNASSGRHLAEPSPWPRCHSSRSSALRRAPTNTGAWLRSVIAPWSGWCGSPGGGSSGGVGGMRTWSVQGKRRSSGSAARTPPLPGRFGTGSDGSESPSADWTFPLRRPGSRPCTTGGGHSSVLADSHLLVSSGAGRHDRHSHDDSAHRKTCSCPGPVHSPHHAHTRVSGPDAADVLRA
jgi:hypothetical protein